MRDIGIRVQRLVICTFQIGSRFTIQIVNLKNLITKLEEPKCIFTAICHIKESVFILVFLVNCRHQSSCNRKICQRQMSRNSIETLCYNLLHLPVGGRMFLTKTYMAFSALRLILFRTT